MALVALLTLAAFTHGAAREHLSAVPEDFSCVGQWLGVQQQLAWSTALAGDTVPLPDGAAALLAGSGDEGGCALGRLSLRLVALLALEVIVAEAAAKALGTGWRILNAVGWAAVVRSGWPVFQLLDMLHGRRLAGRAGSDNSTAPAGGHALAPCRLGDPYMQLLAGHLAGRPPPASRSLAARSLAYLEAGPGVCPLTLAAALVALAWSRLPVFDGESEELLRQAEPHVHRAGLVSLLAAPHPLTGVLSRVAAARQLPSHFGIVGLESATLDVASRSGDDGAGGGGPEGGTPGGCVVRISETPSGGCNIFAPISHGLAPWRARGGIGLEDVARAFRPVTDQKTILFRVVGDELMLVTPQHTHLDAEFGATELACLAHAILAVLARAHLPDFDIVLNHGDLPILRKRDGKPPFYGPTDRDARVPAPLFSISASDDFWDILFPNVCRPALVNMSAMSSVPWGGKRGAAFWRGTDRGAVNWAREVRDMYRGSPRRRFLDRWGGRDAFNLAFLEDDLLNASVVNADPNFVPLDRWPEWRYLLDLPGNGYSGSLKQKLTASSAVLLLTDVGVPGTSPVYEHYHGGLRDFVHVLRISMDDAMDKVEWAQGHGERMQQIVRSANDYMSNFEALTQCYLWQLLDQYGRMLKYRPDQGQISAFGSDVSVRTLQVHRRPLQQEAEAFESACRDLTEQSAQ